MVSLGPFQLSAVIALFRISSFRVGLGQSSYQVSKQFDVGMFDVDGGAEPPRVPGDVVGEDDGPHRRLPGARLAHQQHLLLHDGDRRLRIKEWFDYSRIQSSELFQFSLTQ